MPGCRLARSASTRAYCSAGDNGAASSTGSTGTCTANFALRTSAARAIRRSISSLLHSAISETGWTLAASAMAVGLSSPSSRRLDSETLRASRIAATWPARIPEARATRNPSNRSSSSARNIAASSSRRSSVSASDARNVAPSLLCRDTEPRADLLVARAAAPQLNRGELARGEVFREARRRAPSGSLFNFSMRNFSSTRLLAFVGA